MESCHISDSYRLLLPASQMERRICTQKPRRTLHPLFVESLQELTKMEYYCDLFLYGTAEDIKEFKKYEERLVKRIADRIRDFRQSDKRFLRDARERCPKLYRR